MSLTAKFAENSTLRTVSHVCVLSLGTGTRTDLSLDHGDLSLRTGTHVHLSLGTGDHFARRLARRFFRLDLSQGTGCNAPARDSDGGASTESPYSAVDPHLVTPRASPLRALPPPSPAMHDLDRQLIPILVAEDAMTAAAVARRFGLRWGMTARAAAELAIAVAELARNVALHAGFGEIELVAGPKGIDVVARDRGPGVLDEGVAPSPARARTPEVTDGAHDSGSPHSARGRGLGIGRDAIRRLMDEMNTRPREGGGWEVACRKRWA